LYNNSLIHNSKYNNKGTTLKKYKYRFQIETINVKHDKINSIFIYLIQIKYRL
jgi:hypothetical protein